MSGKLAASVWILVATTLAGCATPVRTTGLAHIPEKNLIFNPEWTGLPVLEVARASWPSTAAFSSLVEQIDYRETIIDRQGSFGHDLDFLYRRFDSVRSGRAYP